MAALGRRFDGNSAWYHRRVMVTVKGESHEVDFDITNPITGIDIDDILAAWQDLHPTDKR